MSKESFTRFLDQVAQDEALQRDLAAIASGSGPAATITADELARFGSAHGFDFTADDVRSHTVELGEDELNHVAGGFSWGMASGGVGQKGWSDFGPAPGGVGQKGWSDFVPLGALLGGHRP